ISRRQVMKRVMVRYTVKGDRVDENQRFIAQVFEQLEREKPDGIRYASFRLDDGRSFVHIASHESDGINPLTTLASFKAFTANIKDRCEVPPVTAQWSEIGSYRLFG